MCIRDSVEQGYFLACQARPDGRLRLQDDSTGPEPVDSVVEEIRLVAPDVVRILLRPEQQFEFRPGQYLDVLHPEGSARNYSLASLPSSGLFELHVRHVPDGLVSGWLHGRRVGDPVRVRGPFGQCFLVAGEPEKRLLLVGAGTGLAPLLGIARDAQRMVHRGAVDLIHGGLVPERLYLREELKRFADDWPQLSVHHCVLREATESEHAGALDEVAVQLAATLDDTRAFLCGDDAIVRALRRRLFLAGLASREIFADPFVPAAR